MADDDARVLLGGGVPPRCGPAAWCQADIAALSDLVAGEPVRLDDADYAWRVETTRDEWQAAMKVLVGEIT